MRHSTTQAVQDYLKAVYRLSKPGELVGTTQLAEQLEVAPASVTGMLKKLSKLGYLSYEPRQGVGLTAKGTEVALEILRHHRLLESFFVERLGMDWQQAHREAEVLEHYISEELETILDKEMGYPTADPQGAPIPTRDGTIEVIDWPDLSEVSAGSTVVIRRVKHPEPELMAYVERLGMNPGRELVVREVPPFEQPILVSTDKGEMQIGLKVARAILIEVIKPPTD